MTSSNRIYIYDTTLRDGAQTQGVDFSVEDKAAIARALEDLGVDYIEGGWPGANPNDVAFFAERAGAQSTPARRLRHDPRAGRSAGERSRPARRCSTPRRRVALVGKTWDFQVDVALGTRWTKISR